MSTDPEDDSRRDVRFTSHYHRAQVEDRDRSVHTCPIPPHQDPHLRAPTDYDRILVLNMGTIAEYDTPAALLEKEGGLFREMCMQSADWEEIQDMVKRG